jgi:hypothetical protein
LSGGCGLGSGCLGKGATTFGNERDGSPDKDGDDGNTWCDRTRTVFYKSKNIVDKEKNKTICTAALSSAKIAQLCGGGRCFCGRTMAKVTYKGRTLMVPVEDRGDEATFKRNGAIIDLTGACMNLIDPDTKERTLKNAIVEIQYNKSGPKIPFKSGQLVN